MPWPVFEVAPREKRPLWQLVIVVVAVVAGSTALLSTCAHAATHSVCSTHCTTATRQAVTCTLRKIGGSWVRICG